MSRSPVRRTHLNIHDDDNSSVGSSSTVSDTAPRPAHGASASASAASGRAKPSSDKGGAAATGAKAADLRNNEAATLLATMRKFLDVISPKVCVHTAQRLFGSARHALKRHQKDCGGKKLPEQYLIDFRNHFNQLAAEYLKMTTPIGQKTMLDAMNKLLLNAEINCRKLAQATSRKRPRQMAAGAAAAGAAAAGAATARPAQRRRFQTKPTTAASSLAQQSTAQQRPQRKPATIASRIANARAAQARAAQIRAAQARAQVARAAQIRAAQARAQVATASSRLPALPASAASMFGAPAQAVPSARAVATGHLPAQASSAASMFGAPTGFTTADKQGAQALRSLLGAASNTEATHQQAPGNGPTTR